jgi:sulfur carrier protein ThiS adenylyltransferase
MTGGEAGIFARNVPGSTEILAAATVAVAGCGGLGSNAAVALVRAGVGRLILVDDDVVELSNLNRQHYFQADLGRPKVEALAGHLRAIHPAVGLELSRARLTPDEVPRLFAAADLLVEAFDRAESKRWLIEAWCRAFPERPVVCGSGLSGLGRTEALGVRRAGRIVLCGDERSQMAEGLCAPRVVIVSAMQANVAVELLVAARRAVGT